MADPIVKCDGCGQPGRRRPGYPCPEHWFFIETVNVHTRHAYVVWACSEACRDSMWKRGPGANVIDEDGSTRLHAKQEKGVARG